jgi:hypothetical protein
MQDARNQVVSGMVLEAQLMQELKQREADKVFGKKKFRSTRKNRNSIKKKKMAKASRKANR